jgi:ligand-binding SRPBCC domain-containing protein
MPRFEKASVIKARADQLFEFFLDPNNLGKISPPSLEIIEIRATTPLTKGSQFSLKARKGRMRIDWDGRVIELERPRLMVDEQTRGPFRRFVHIHRFRDIGDHTMLIDEVEYETRSGLLGKLANVLFIRRQMREMFEHRHLRLKELFESGKEK